MANQRIGSHASFSGNVLFKIDTTGYQCTLHDSGKKFMCHQDSSAIHVNLPKLGAGIAGWNAKFYLANEDSGAFHVKPWGVTGTTATGDSGVTNDGDTIINNERVHEILRASETKDWGEVADGAELTENITLTGAVLGDFALASMSGFTNGVDLALTALVTASDTVTVQLFNNTGGALDMDSATLYAGVIRRTSFPLESRDSVSFDGTYAQLGSVIDVFTDGTLWYVESNVQQSRETYSSD